MLSLVKEDQDRDLERFRNMEDQLVRSLIHAYQIDPMGTGLSKQSTGARSIQSGNNNLWLRNWVRPRLEVWQVRQAHILLMELVDELESELGQPGASHE